MQRKDDDPPKKSTSIFEVTSSYDDLVTSEWGNFANLSHVNRNEKGFKPPPSDARRDLPGKSDFSMTRKSHQSLSESKKIPLNEMESPRTLLILNFADLSYL